MHMKTVNEGKTGQQKRRHSWSQAPLNTHRGIWFIPGTNLCRVFNPLSFWHCIDDKPVQTA